MDITVFLGAPGSGKGTQAKRLSEEHAFKHLSTGDMLRAAMRAGTPVGLKAKGFVDQGKLVPDDVMIELIETTLRDLPEKTRVILDGFPRTLAQAQALDKNPRTPVKQSIYFEVPESRLVERLTGRRTCSKCGESYHVPFLPPKVAGKCDKCQGDLVQRTDDSESVVKTRLQVYKEQTSPLLDYFKKRDKLRTVNADLDVSAVQSQLLSLL